MTAAAGLAYLFGDGRPAHDLNLRLLAQTATTITLGWTPLPGAAGYRFSREGYTRPDGTPRYSHTFDPAADRVRFAAGVAWYRVEALAVAAQDTYPREAD